MLKGLQYRETTSRTESRGIDGMAECNIQNRTIFCHDNLDVLQGINSECIDLIYLDPPFNKNKKFAAPIGSIAEGAGFKDIFREEDVKSEWLTTIREDHPELYRYLSGIMGVGKKYNFACLAYMAIRLIECHRLLKPAGSIYLHCDPTMSHYLKTAMDCVFGEEGFRNEIVWCYTGPSNVRNHFPRKHDVLLFYANRNFSFNRDAVRIPYNEETIARRGRIEGSQGIISESAETLQKRSRETVTRLFGAGKVPEDWWTDIPILTNQSERTGYPTQKPLDLMKRIINSSSNEGDMVLDPFCGCATTCVAAEMLDRRWMGIDVSFKAYELVKHRLETGVADPHDTVSHGKEIHMRTSPPTRTDLGAGYREQKFVYVMSNPRYPGEYKVGIASNWQSRLNAYQTSDSDRGYRIEYKLETPYFRELEKHIHDAFPNKHEWVEGDLEEIKKEINNYRG
ncbi:MAG: hypothetical protein F4X92_03910 [Gammaproteobacteria bacterium]|nr:hypothetical protein [Gammaproteobacteria bacterium]